MQVGERAEALIDYFAVDADGCPFCFMPRHDSPTVGDASDIPVVSLPAEIGCEPIPGAGAGRYATARHHLVPALQCYAKVPQLVRMGDAVSFDINHPGNGMALPTVAGPYLLDGAQKGFGELPESRRVLIARYWMRELASQWHDGDGHLDRPLEERDPAGMEDEGSLDHPGYDQVVIARLMREMAQLATARPCQDDQDRSAEIRERLQAISDVEIRGKLSAFAEPRASHPFFVSRYAWAFACEAAAGTTSEDPP